MLDYNILQVVNVVAIQQHIMCACPVQFKKEVVMRTERRGDFEW